jgi:hypothetical protein
VPFSTKDLDIVSEEAVAAQLKETLLPLKRIKRVLARAGSSPFYLTFFTLISGLPLPFDMPNIPWICAKSIGYPGQCVRNIMLRVQTNYRYELGRYFLLLCGLPVLACWQPEVPDFALSACPRGKRRRNDATDQQGGTAQSAARNNPFPKYDQSARQQLIGRMVGRSKECRVPAASALTKRL